jgi:hypothetical protein
LYIIFRLEFPFTKNPFNCHKCTGAGCSKVD